MKTVPFRGENRLKLANMITSHNARTARKGFAIRFSDSTDSKSGLARDNCDLHCARFERMLEIVVR